MAIHLVFIANPQDCTSCAWLNRELRKRYRYSKITTLFLLQSFLSNNDKFAHCKSIFGISSFPDVVLLLMTLSTKREEKKPGVTC